MLKPSMKEEVTNHIYIKKFNKNPIFRKFGKAIGRLLPKIVPIHFNLDDIVMD
jgi:hypothetical protein